MDSFSKWMRSAEVEDVRRFWVRKTEPWEEMRRDSKREVRRVRNWAVRILLVH